MADPPPALPPRHPSGIFSPRMVEAAAFLSTVAARERQRSAWPSSSIQSTHALQRLHALETFEQACERHGLDSSVRKWAAGSGGRSNAGRA